MVSGAAHELTDTTDPTRTMIMGAFSQFEKARLVAKLKVARERSRNMGDRPGLAETHPEAVALAKRLAHGSRKQALSLQDIAAELRKAGHVNSKGNEYSAKVVRDMIKGEVDCIFIRPLTLPRHWIVLEAVCGRPLSKLLAPRLNNL